MGITVLLMTPSPWCCGAAGQTLLLMRTFSLLLLLCSCRRASCPPPHPGFSNASGCFRVDSCRCIMKDGSGVMDLRTVGDADGFLGRLRPVWTEGVEAGTEVLLSFRPCQPFSQPEDLTSAGCRDVAVCLILRKQPLLSRYLDYGRHAGSQFHYDQSQRTLLVSYHSDSRQPLTVVHYHCNPNLSTSFIQHELLGPQEPLHIWVESPCACPNGCAVGDLGLGTIFLILLSFSAATYFLLGSCALRSFRSSSGVQMSPETSVWCMMFYQCAERRPLERSGTPQTGPGGNTLHHSQDLLLV